MPAVSTLPGNHRRDLHALRFPARCDLIPDAIKRTLLAVGIAVIVSMILASAHATSPSPAPQVKFKEFALYASPPKYPTDALRSHAEGSGGGVMEIDEKTGWVKSAKMEKSTGKKLLDDAALQAFSRWRFRPGTIRRLRTPITFTYTGSRIRHRMAGAVISD